MPRIRLIHWHAGEAQALAAPLERAGNQVDCALPQMPAFLRELEAEAPAAVVISLERVPSQGRALALALRQRKGTRGFPLVFAGGAPDKVERTRRVLPDAAFAAWDCLPAALAGVLAAPRAAPVAPASVFDDYAGRPLTAKLGIRAGMTVALVGAPEKFAASLPAVPDGVRFVTRGRAKPNLTLWFVRGGKKLQQGIARRAAAAQPGPLWILWPKKASALACELTQQLVRKTGLAHGLVDYKICAVDATWSGLLFRRRVEGDLSRLKSPPGPRPGGRRGRGMGSRRRSRG